MNTALLQYAVEVEKTGSITQAAANLFMDQPNLSKAIKSLEEGLGAPVFKRTPKGVVPTAKGKIFLEYARNILAQIEEMERLYKPVQGTGTEFSLSMPRASYMAFAFSRFIKKLGTEGAMNVWLRETNSADTLRDVESGEYRLGILRFPASSEKYYAQEAKAQGLVMEEIFEYTPRLIMSKSHPLAQKEEISKEELAPYPEIIHGDGGPHAKGEPTRECGTWQSTRRIYVFERGSQFDILCEEANAYMWVSPMPSQILKRYGLVEKKGGKWAGIYKDMLVYRKGSILTDWDKSFLEELALVKHSLEIKD